MIAEARDTEVDPDALRAALRSRAGVADPDFDRLYPDPVRRLSRVHWTPVSVALRAAALLAPEPGMRVLDAGAGAGKLCCIGALAQAARWHGVEIDPSLVAAAIAAARSLEIEDRTSFVIGDMLEVDWTSFDSIYLYNPFECQLFGGGFAERAAGANMADLIARTEQRLSELPAGTRVVTFHGFGGKMPPGFALATGEVVGDGELVLWVKRPVR